MKLAVVGAKGRMGQAVIRLAGEQGIDVSRALDKGDECSLLAEALTTHGTALARTGKDARARTTLQRAIGVAETCGDLEGAGRAIVLDMVGQFLKETAVIARLVGRLAIVERHRIRLRPA